MNRTGLSLGRISTHKDKDMTVSKRSRMWPITDLRAARIGRVVRKRVVSASANEETTNDVQVTQTRPTQQTQQAFTKKPASDKQIAAAAKARAARAAIAAARAADAKATNPPDTLRQKRIAAAAKARAAKAAKAAARKLMGGTLDKEPGVPEAANPVNSPLVLKTFADLSKLADLRNSGQTQEVEEVEMADEVVDGPVVLNVPIDKLHDYMAQIKEDYISWRDRTGPTLAEMNESELKTRAEDELVVSINAGSVYLAVEVGHHGISVIHSFIVNRPPKVHGKQFHVGDVLKPSNRKSPLTNYTHGNVMSGVRDLRWTGVA